MAKTNKPTIALKLEVLADSLDRAHANAKDMEIQHRMEVHKTGNKVSQMSADYQEGYAHGIRRAQALIAEIMGVK